MYMRVTESYGLTLLCSLCCLIVGCGSNSATVTGQVTLNAQPVSSGMVTFHSQGKTQTIAVGQIDKSGNFQLLVGTDTTLPLGEYVATVSVPELVPNSNPMEEAIYKETAPEKYQNTETSGLKFTVKGGSNHFTLPLLKNSVNEPK
jgi:hypothetical protein